MNDNLRTYYAEVLDGSHAVTVELLERSNTKHTIILSKPVFDIENMIKTVNLLKAHITSENKWRVYATMNGLPLDANMPLEYAQELLTLTRSRSYKKMMRLPTTISQKHMRNDRYMVDFDSKDLDQLSAFKMEPELQGKRLLLQNETENGYHLVFERFDKRLLERYQEADNTLKTMLLIEWESLDANA